VSSSRRVRNLSQQLQLCLEERRAALSEQRQNDPNPNRAKSKRNLNKSRRISFFGNNELDRLDEAALVCRSGNYLHTQSHTHTHTHLCLPLPLLLFKLIISPSSNPRHSLLECANCPFSTNSKYHLTVRTLCFLPPSLPPFLPSSLTPGAAVSATMNLSTPSS